MRICWVTSDVWYSYLLRWIFKAQTSHVGSVFSTGDIDTVVDINRPVGKTYTLRSWLSHYRIVHQVEVILPPEQELELFEAVKSYAVGREYDVRGYYYGMAWGLIHRILPFIPLPKVNHLSVEGKDMCQEIVRPILSNPIIKSITDISTDRLNTMTPDQSMELIRKATAGNPQWKWSYYG